MRHLPVLLCLSVLPMAARAADAPLPPAFVALLTGAEHRNDLLQAAHAVAAEGGDACKAATYATTGELAFFQPLKTDAGGKPTGGAWKESIIESGCGAPRTLNALTVVKPDGSLDTSPLLPGSTITDPQLQEDSVQYAAAVLGEMPAGCQGGSVVDTQFIAVDGTPPGTKPDPGAMPRPWSENWMLQACAKKATAVMHFMPDATGTAIRATPASP